MARPTLSYLKNLLLFLFGLPCGVFGGLTAIGSSVAVAPLSGYLLGLRGTRASGTALSVTFFAALAALLSYSTHGDIRWGLALVLAAGQTAGVLMGQRLLNSAPALIRLHVLWASLTVALGLGMTADALGIGGGHHELALAAVPGAAGWLWALVLAGLVGVASRVMSLGGVFVVPAAIYGLGLTPPVAQGTALVVLLLASLPGVLVHARRGELEPQSATWMSAGAVFGSLVGAFYATSALSPATLLLVFGIALTLLGVSLLWRNDAG